MPQGEQKANYFQRLQRRYWISFNLLSGEIFGRVERAHQRCRRVGRVQTNMETPPPNFPEQVACGGRLDSIRSVGFYHGGDVLYQLKNAPGTWHQELLEGA
jgi:hypothetical protein